MSFQAGQQEREMIMGAFWETVVSHHRDSCSFDVAVKLAPLIRTNAIAYYEAEKQRAATEYTKALVLAAVDSVAKKMAEQDAGLAQDWKIWMLNELNPKAH